MKLVNFTAHLMQVEVRYVPPDRRDGGTLENVALEKPNAVRATTP